MLILIALMTGILFILTVSYSPAFFIPTIFGFMLLGFFGSWGEPRETPNNFVAPRETFRFREEQPEPEPESSLITKNVNEEFKKMKKPGVSRSGVPQ